MPSLKAGAPCNRLDSSSLSLLPAASPSAHGVADVSRPNKSPLRNMAVEQNQAPAGPGREHDGRPRQTEPAFSTSADSNSSQAQAVSRIGEPYQQGSARLATWREPFPPQQRRARGLQVPAPRAARQRHVLFVSGHCVLRGCGRGGLPGSRPHPVRGLSSGNSLETTRIFGQGTNYCRFHLVCPPLLLGKKFGERNFV